jgi:hypothetical protein
MAADWIKMRIWLRKDPKLIRMADLISTDRYFMRWLTDPVQQGCKDTAYEHVSPAVTRCLCVTALLEIWGTAREQGRRENEDLIVDCCDSRTVDEVADIPGIGGAMVKVGWLVERDDESALFPKFFQEKELISERLRSRKAENQAAYRQRQRQQSDNGAVTRVTGRVTESDHRGEERRGEKRRTTTTPLSPASTNGQGGGGDGIDWTKAKATANEIIRYLGIAAPKDGKYRRLIVQAAALEATPALGTQWIEDANEDTRLAKPNRPWQYWAACLRSGAEARGVKLDTLLAGLTVPAEFLTKGKS